MRFSRSASLQRKLTWMTMFTSSVVLVLACAGFAAHEIFSIRSSMTRELSIMADLIGASSVAALDFDDRRAGEEALSALRIDPRVVFACLYTQEGSLFASYCREGAGECRPPSALRAEAAYLEDGCLHLFRPVRLGERALGTIFIQADLHRMYTRLVRYALIASAVFAFGSLLALLLSNRLQRSVSAPVLRLAETASRVSERQDYSIRAVKETEDELGLLVEKFNEMMSHIQTQAAALRQAHDELEKRVEERTRKLKQEIRERQRAEKALKEQAAELKSANERLAREIAYRRQTEQELVRLERLRALGEMASGVSHNLNNILSGILLPAELLKVETDDPAILRNVEHIVESTTRATELVKRLHQAVRGGKETIEPVEVDEMVRRVVQETRPRWKDEPEARGIVVRVKTRLGDVPPIEGTRSGLHDILVNLIFNAVDALPEGGTITIETESVEGNVRLKVRDDGIGMNEEIRRRVFEPFFTTKADVGTGLGLSTVYGTVSRWGGSIQVESAPGEGTTFLLHFPASSRRREEKTEAAPRIRPVRRGKILVVDDEAMICDLLLYALSKDHHVETVRSGKSVLDGLEPGLYDVALIDLGMPGLSGDKLVRKMKEIDDSIATILISGWEFDEQDPVLCEFDFHIQKPLRNLDEIRSVVARALELHDARSGGRHPDRWIE